MPFEIDLCNKIYILLIFFVCGKGLAKLRTAQGKIESYCTASLMGNRENGEKEKKARRYLRERPCCSKLLFFSSDVSGAFNPKYASKRTAAPEQRDAPPSSNGGGKTLAMFPNYQLQDSTAQQVSWGKRSFQLLVTSYNALYACFAASFKRHRFPPYLRISNKLAPSSPCAVPLLQPVLLLLLLAASRLRSGGGALPARSLRGGGGGAGGLRRRGLDDDGG